MPLYTDFISVPLWYHYIANNLCTSTLCFILESVTPYHSGLSTPLFCFVWGSQIIKRAADKAIITLTIKSCHSP